MLFIECREYHLFENSLNLYTTKYLMGDQGCGPWRGEFFKSGGLGLMVDYLSQRGVDPLCAMPVFVPKVQIKALYL